MTNLSSGILSVNILKAKNLQKIENGTKKKLTIKKPIIKIEYISGTKISSPAKGQGESFEWNYKINFELIKDKTSFFMQCYNNGIEDNFNLLGETRIPLILAIENENFKQWYPIYLKEKKNKFVCRGEILLDMYYYSYEKIKNNNINFSQLAEDRIIHRNSLNTRKESLLLNKPINHTNSEYSYDSSTDKSEFQIQPPAIKPRTTRNSGYISNSIYNLENNKLYEDMDDIPYDDEFFENNYNDSYNFKNMKRNRIETPISFSVNDIHHPLLTNNINEISRSYSANTSTNIRKKRLNHFNSLPSLKDSKSDFLIDINNNNNNYNQPLITSSNKMVIPIPKSPVSLSSSIITPKSSIKMEKNSIDIINKRLSIATLCDNPNYHNSDINNSLKISLPRSLQNASNNNKYVYRKALSDDGYDIYNNDNGNESFISLQPSHSVVPIFNNMNTINDKELYGIINSQSKSYDLEFNKHNNIPMENRSFQSLIDTSSPQIRPNSTSLSMVNNYSNSIKKLYPLNDNLIDINMNEEQKRVKINNDETLKNNINIKSSIKNQKKSITMSELTLDERAFIKKMNEKYKTNIILIDENISSSSDEDETKDNTSNHSENITNLCDKKDEEKNMNVNIKKSKSKRFSKNIFKSLFSIKCNKKEKNENKSYNSDQISIKRNYNKNALKKIKSIVSIRSNKNDKASLSSKENSNNKNMKKKLSIINNGSLKILNKTMELNKENLNLSNKKSKNDNKNYKSITELSEKDFIETTESNNINIKSIPNEPNTEFSHNISNGIKEYNKLPYQPMKSYEIINKQEIEKMVEYNEKKTEDNIDSLLYDNNNQINKYEIHKMTTINKGKNKMPENNEYIDNDKKQILDINQKVFEQGNDVSTKINSVINDNIDNEILKYSNEDYYNNYLNNYHPLNMSQSIKYSDLFNSDNSINNFIDNNSLYNMRKDTYSEQMIQKLQFQQLSQRISLSYNHYKEYQNLMTNDEKQPYHEFSKRKEELFKKHQDQIRMLTELHSQQRSDLLCYLKQINK